MSNRAPRRRAEKLARIAKRNRHAEQVVAIVLTRPPPPPWKRDDAAWFTAHPRRSHRVRDGFPGEFERASGGPVDFVVVRQIQPGLRIRASFTLAECGADALGMMQALALRALDDDDEAAAHTLFDMTQAGAGGRSIPTVELAELIARHAIAPDSRTN